MLDIVEMMARCLIWNGANLNDESDCMRALCVVSGGSFELRAVGKYVQRAMKIAREMDK